MPSQKRFAHVPEMSAGCVAWLLVLLCACGAGDQDAPAPVARGEPAGAIAQMSTPAPGTIAQGSTPAAGTDMSPSTTSMPSASPPAAPADETVGPERWTRVLDGLNRARSRALHRMRPALLDRVYVRGSPVLRRERALLAAYRDRGVDLRGGRLHTASVRVVTLNRRLVVLRTVETLGTTTAVLGRGHRVRLPADSPTRRALRLVRTAAGWRVAAVGRLAG